MTAAAFHASYADFKLIKGRKCAQIILEVPIEAADAALTALGGVPQPHIETWLAIARLDTKAVSEPPKAIAPPAGDGAKRSLFMEMAKDRDAPPKERRSWSALSYAEQAGIRCQEPDFWQFVNESNKPDLPIDSGDSAAEYVRDFCGVKSRSEIKTFTDGAMKWRRLDAEYESWQRRPVF